MFNVGNRPVRIAIGVGHANSSGGNPFERATAAKTVNEFLKLARASHGFDVRCYTPNEGLGMYPGPLNAAANEVNKWLAQGWHADILWEVHSQGTTAAHRGSFVIYPDGQGLRSHRPNPDDIDTDVRDHGRVMAGIIAEHVGVPVWQQGIMSERNTGVGRQGFRLGLFGQWSDAPFVNRSCRVLSEDAHHTNAQDLAIMQRPDHPAKRARGILEAMASLAKVRGRWVYPYRIGAGAPPAPGPTPPGPTPPSGYGLPIPDSMVRERFPEYNPDPAGVVSKLWREHGLATGMWPAFEEIQTFGAARLFCFESGLIIIADEQGVRLAKGDT